VARHAVFTIVQDDPANLKIWALYYRQFYSCYDTFILHHPLPGEPFDADWIMMIGIDIADNRHGAGEPDDKGFMLIPGVFREESFNHTWLRETVQAFQRFLLQSYDTVLFAEVDEIVVPVDGKMRPYGLDRYLEDFAAVPAREREIARCTGYEVVHDYTCEPPLDFEDYPLLRQRTYWYRSLQYSKPLLAKIPLTWVNGFHCLNVAEQAHPWEGLRPNPNPDPGLLLLHLHKLDFPQALARHRRTASRRWSAHDVQTRQGIQNQVDDEGWLREWWLNSVDQPYARARWTRMPDEIREIA
jgi:hypothetical protein